jgi:hypothetical protein
MGGSKVFEIMATEANAVFEAQKPHAKLHGKPQG